MAETSNSRVVLYGGQVTAAPGTTLAQAQAQEKASGYANTARVDSSYEPKYTDTRGNRRTNAEIKDEYEKAVSAQINKDTGKPWGSLQNFYNSIGAFFKGNTNEADQTQSQQTAIAPTDRFSQFKADAKQFSLLAGSGLGDFLTTQSLLQKGYSQDEITGYFSAMKAQSTFMATGELPKDFSAPLTYKMRPGKQVYKPEFDEFAIAGAINQAEIVKFGALSQGNFALFNFLSSPAGEADYVSNMFGRPVSAEQIINIGGKSARGQALNTGMFQTYEPYDISPVGIGFNNSVVAVKDNAIMLNSSVTPQPVSTQQGVGFALIGTVLNKDLFSASSAPTKITTPLLAPGNPNTFSLKEPSFSEQWSMDYSKVRDNLKTQFGALTPVFTPAFIVSDTAMGSIGFGLRVAEGIPASFGIGPGKPVQNILFAPYQPNMQEAIIKSEFAESMNVLGTGKTVIRVNGKNKVVSVDQDMVDTFSRYGQLAIVTVGMYQGMTSAGSLALKAEFAIDKAALRGNPTTDIMTGWTREGGYDIFMTKSQRSGLLEYTTQQKIYAPRDVAIPGSLIAQGSEMIGAFESNVFKVRTINEATTTIGPQMTFRSVSRAIVTPADVFEFIGSGQGKSGYYKTTNFGYTGIVYPKQGETPIGFISSIGEQPNIINPLEQGIQVSTTKVKTFFQPLGGKIQQASFVDRIAGFSEGMNPRRGASLIQSSEDLGIVTNILKAEKGMSDWAFLKTGTKITTTAYFENPIKDAQYVFIKETIIGKTPRVSTRKTPLIFTDKTKPLLKFKPENIGKERPTMTNERQAQIQLPKTQVQSQITKQRVASLPKIDIGFADLSFTTMDVATAVRSASLFASGFKTAQIPKLNEATRPKMTFMQETMPQQNIFGFKSLMPELTMPNVKMTIPQIQMPTQITQMSLITTLPMKPIVPIIETPSIPITSTPSIGFPPFFPGFGGLGFNDRGGFGKTNKLRIKTQPLLDLLTVSKRLARRR